MSDHVTMTDQVGMTARPEMSGQVTLGPRIRWAGVVWGLALAAVAAGGLWLLSVPGALAEAGTVALRLSASEAVALALLVLGALILVTGLVGVLGRAQRARATRRALAADPATELAAHDGA